MIERGHEHSLQPISVRDLEDGRKVVQLRCAGGCGLEEQRTVRGGHVERLRFRFNGLWFGALDLIRVAEGLGVKECEACGGEAGLAPCERCGDLGVTGLGGEPLAAPDLRGG